MSVRRRPALVDGFDSRKVGTFNQLPRMNAEAIESPTYQTVPNLTVSEALGIIHILFKDYQSKHFPVSDNLWIQWFPFAWLVLNVGDEIKNLDTQEIYRIEEVIKTDPSHRRNLVKLRGANAPKNWHILRLDDKKNNLLNIIPAYPDVENKPMEFGQDGNIRDENTDPWIDTITYSILTEQPGSRNKKMFNGDLELTPKYRETVGSQEIYGQMIDTKVRFDFWTQNNKASELLREWFRDFTNKYRWLIQENGVSQFHWVNSYTDMNAARWRTSILHRSAVYDMRTEYSFVRDISNVRTVDIVANISRMTDEGQQTLTMSLDGTLSET